MKLWTAAVVGIGLGLTTSVGCKVSLGDDLVYSCTKDSDCAGDGFTCAAPSGGAGLCCKPAGAEVCNGRDDDCNGQIDEGMAAELCNGKDDDCDGQIDEGFNLQFDSSNCGQCGHVCATLQLCASGNCFIAGEVICNDGLDNESDGKADCSDPDCDKQLCGPGCQCRALKKAEGNCDNGMDDDGDTKFDCADEDCGGAGCGDGGCSCSMGMRTETGCNDTADNDGDGQSDCSDSDCAGQLCKAFPQTWRCGGDNSCLCNDGGVVQESGGNCRDGKDNDCDGLTDCADAPCDGLSCAPDGGMGCLCSGGQAHETTCGDRRDNDGDGFTDCADALPDGGGDCPINTACTYLNSGGAVKNGACSADRLCK
jgi:hypothetical protein